MRVLIFFCFVVLHAGMPLGELYRLADGMNIEGARVQQACGKEGQVWANLCVVLDRPIETGVEWKALKALTPYPLKEASLTEYNEVQANYTYLSIMYYYIRHARELFEKEGLVHVNIHVFRNSSGAKHLELLKHLLAMSIPNPERYGVKLTFSHGVETMEVADINVSFSLVVGLNRQDPSGSLYIPFAHVPFSLSDLVYDERRLYRTENHLLESVREIVAHQPHWLCSVVNHYFTSLNGQKNSQSCKLLNFEDFKCVKLLQIDGIFNPSELEGRDVCVVK
ncbi:MAG: hypothetical protein MRY21_03000 [Simkaniaceae bacterium]|nr:hypothetical protein [Simkaniaceae bacterium]